MVNWNIHERGTNREQDSEYFETTGEDARSCREKSEATVGRRIRDVESLSMLNDEP